MNHELAKTPLHQWHASHGGRMVDFAGWSMPVQYTSIVEEHQATRKAFGLFDVSHMGRLRFTGPQAAQFLDQIVTRRVTDMTPGQVRYGLVTNEAGGILDDVLVYRLADQPDTPVYQMVVNASNRTKIVDWLRQHQGQANVELTDQTTATAMIAVQGPLAVSTLKPLLNVDLAGMKYYTCKAGTVAGKQALISRTGYTGEDGCELIVEARDAVAVWESVLAVGQGVGAIPCGLASRDTLRLEAAMPLYGHELSEQINPIQAGLKFALNLKDRQFIGRDAIARFAEDPQQLQRVGLKLDSRRVPREGYPIVSGDGQGQPLGEVTSGTFSPTFDYPIAMGYVRPAAAQPGSAVAIDIRGRLEPATIVPLPFYKRES